MRIETVPLILGVLVAMLGIGIMFDAWTPDVTVASRERRRRPRIERHRNGEAMIGLGVLALGAAFIGRDSWRYSTLVVIIGALCLIVGTVLNAGYFREMFVNRGPLRRREQPKYEDAPNDEKSVLEREKALTADAPPPAPAREGWDGTERRQTPRGDSARVTPRRGVNSEDSTSP